MNLRKTRKPKDPHVFQWVLTYNEEGDLHYHGQIRGVSPCGYYYKVQLYSAWTGEPTDIVILPAAMVRPGPQRRVKLFTDEMTMLAARRAWWNRQLSEETRS